MPIAARRDRGLCLHIQSQLSVTRDLVADLRTRQRLRIRDALLAEDEAAVRSFAKKYNVSKRTGRRVYAFVLHAWQECRYHCGVATRDGALGVQVALMATR